MYPTLQAASAKLDRASKDNHTAQTEARALVNRQPYRISVDFEPETGWHVARVKIVEEPGPALAVLYSAVAYQCRSALNLIVWELASRKVGRRKLAANRHLAGQVQFPIATSPEKFLSNSVRAHISKPALTIIEGLQPYNRVRGALVEGHPLCIIKMVTDTDKHRVLPGGFGAIRIRDMKFVWDETIARGPTIEPAPQPPLSLKDEAALGRIRFEVGNAHANVSVDRQPDAEVMFECGNWALSMPDISSCVATTRQCLRELAPLFPGQQFPWPPS